MAENSTSATPFWRRMAPGLLLCAVVGLAAMALDQWQRQALGMPVLEALVAAILIAMFIRNGVRLPQSVDAGANFSAKEVLEFGVMLLGASIDARQALAGGPGLLAGIALVVFGTIGASYVFGRLLGLGNKLAMLVAVGNSICGNSAIAAVAPVIRAEKRDVAASIALTAIIGVVLVLSLPLLMPIAHLTMYQYGVLAGLTVYAVPQVIAASFPVGQLAGEVATLVKLVRVLFLGPVVLLFSLGMRMRDRRQQRVETGGKRPALVPWFIAGFLVLAVLRFFGLIPLEVAGVAKEVSRLLTILAMAGLGLGVEFAALKQAGPRVAGTVTISLLFLISLSLFLILGLRLVG